MSNNLPSPPSRYNTVKSEIRKIMTIPNGYRSNANKFRLSQLIDEQQRLLHEQDAMRAASKKGWFGWGRKSRRGSRRRSRRRGCTRRRKH